MKFPDLKTMHAEQVVTKRNIYMQLFWTGVFLLRCNPCPTPNDEGI